jgi:hypothetical protein
MATKNDDKKSKFVKRLLTGKRRKSPVPENINTSVTAGESSPQDWLPTGKKKGSYLIEETDSMDRKRRLVEQDGHRQLARVNARAHNENDQSPAPEGELQNSILQHPWLDAQRFDGIDPNLNPEPPLNTDARREFDNERREQEMEKQLRLGNMPKFSTAPKPGQP